MLSSHHQLSDFSQLMRFGRCFTKQLLCDYTLLVFFIKFHCEHDFETERKLKKASADSPAAYMTASMMEEIHAI